MLFVLGAIGLASAVNWALNKAVPKAVEMKRMSTQIKKTDNGNSGRVVDLFLTKETEMAIMQCPNGCGQKLGEGVDLLGMTENQLVALGAVHRCHACHKVSSAA